MKSTKAATDATGINKVDSHALPTEEERALGVGAEPYRLPTQQSSRPSPRTPEIVRDAGEIRASPRTAAEAERGLRAPSTQGARSGPARGASGGGGAGMKVNRGFKGATPVDPYSSFSLNVYAKGGPVGKVGGFGLKRSKPDFAGGGSKTNFKMDTKKGKMPW